MIITNVTGNYFLKENDTATEIRLRIEDSEGNPLDIASAPRIEVVIGNAQGRLLTKTPIVMPAPGELEFGLDEGDVLPVGDNNLEVHVFTDSGERHVAPSKGYYRLRVQKAIDSTEVEITTYSLTYFIDEVNRITAGLPELVTQGTEIAGRLDQLLEDSSDLVQDSTLALQQSQSALTQAQEALADASQAAANAQRAEDAAIAAENATAVLVPTNQAAIAATLAANNATTSANNASSSANNAALVANNLSSELQGYNIAITDFNMNTAYLKNQNVRFNGSTYKSKVATQGNPLPVAPALSNQWWDLVAQRGVDGEGAVGSVNGILPDSDGNVNLGNLNTSWENVTGKPTTFEPSEHTHPISEVIGLQTAIDDINDSISEIGQTGIPKLVTYQYVIPATSNGQTTLQIPLESFDPVNDTLFLYRNRTAQPNNVYSVSGRTITLTEPVLSAIDTSFYIRVLKNVPIGTEGSISASVLADGSISESKLDSDARSKLNATFSGDYNDLINAPGEYDLPTASTTVLGGIKPDGTTITVDPNTGIASSLSGVSSNNTPISIRGSIQNIPSGEGITAVTFTSLTDEGNKNYIDISGGRIRFLVPGTYLISANIAFSANSNGYRIVYVTGTSSSQVPSASTPTNISLSSIVSASSNMLLNVNVVQNSGSILTLSTSTINIVKV